MGRPDSNRVIEAIVYTVKVLLIIMFASQDPPEGSKRKTLFAEQDMSKLRVIQSENDTIARKYLMSVGAASVAEAVTYPLDLTKTR